MGGLHRLAYHWSSAARPSSSRLSRRKCPRAARIGLGIVGLMALASSLSGYCVTCHALGLTTRDNRVRRMS